MLVTMDGNDSLKRIIRRLPVATPAEGEPMPEGPQVGDSRELLDSRKVGEEYLISREKVDKWAKTALEELLSESVSLFTAGSALAYVNLLGRRGEPLCRTLVEYDQ
jgi:hypothetical protein